MHNIGRDIADGDGQRVGMKRRLPGEGRRGADHENSFIPKKHTAGFRPSSFINSLNLQFCDPASARDLTHI